MFETHDEIMPDHPNISARNGRLGAQKKSAPADAPTSVNPGLTANKERLMTQRIKSTESDHRTTCLVFLELSKDDLEKARRTRDYYITLAHKYGLSNVAIGEAVGVSEARVRAILTAGDA